MKKALKNIYMLLGAWVFVLLCPVVCCESESSIFDSDEEIVIPVGAIYIRYYNEHPSQFPAKGEWYGNNIWKRGEGEYIFIEIPGIETPFYGYSSLQLKKGRLYDSDGNKIGRIKALSNGDLEIKGTGKLWCLDGVYHHKFDVSPY